MQGRQKSEVIKGLKEKLTHYARLVFIKGLVSGEGGNISVRIPSSDYILITPGGVPLRDVNSKNIVTVDIDGNQIDLKGRFNPSKETAFHTSIYKLRDDAGAVIHAHPPNVTAFAVKGKSLPLLTVSCKIVLKKVPCLNFALPGSVDLSRIINKGIKRYTDVRAFLLKGHGIITFGNNLSSTFDLIDMAEESAKVAIACKII